MNYAIKFYVGVTYDKDGKPIKDLAVKLGEVEKLLAKTYGGYTKYVTTGAWYDKDRQETVLETSNVYEVIEETLDNTLHQAAAKGARHWIANKFKEALNQSSVLLVTVHHLTEKEFI